MPFVKLHYGPYESHGIIKHKPQRLHGIVGCLSAKGYQVEIVVSPHINRLTVEMRGRTIFRCDIRHLRFNVECEDDVVCQRVIGVIEEAAERYYNDRNVAKFVSVNEGMRYLQRRKIMSVADCLTESRVDLIYEVQEQYKSNAEEEEQSNSDDQSGDASVTLSPERSIESKLDSSSDTQSTEGTDGSSAEDQRPAAIPVRSYDEDKEVEKKKFVGIYSGERVGQVVELYENKNRSDRSLEKRVLIDESSVRETSTDRKSESIIEQDVAEEA